jgi:hypothetical protein
MYEWFDLNQGPFEKAYNTYIKPKIDNAESTVGAKTYNCSFISNTFSNPILALGMEKLLSLLFATSRMDPEFSDLRKFFVFSCCSDKEGHEW